MWMLDTNICSYVLRKRPEAVRRRFAAVAAEDLAVSTVVQAELYYGAARHPSGAAIRSEIDDFLRRLRVLSWDGAAAEAYGQLRALLENKGNVIGAMDMMIAAHALSLDATLVSNNLREFRRVKGLRLENWA